MEQTPFMKAIHEFAMADPDDCAVKWAACLALVTDQETASISSFGGSSTPTSTAPLRVPSSAVPFGGISERAAATPFPT